MTDAPPELRAIYYPEPPDERELCYPFKNDTDRHNQLCDQAGLSDDEAAEAVFTSSTWSVRVPGHKRVECPCCEDRGQHPWVDHYYPCIPCDGKGGFSYE